jgi:hypothetical protein
VVAVTVRNICEKRGEGDDGSVNEGREHEACNGERPVGGTSGVLPMPGCASATVPLGSSPSIWLSFLAFLKSLCLSLPSILFLVVSGGGVDPGDKSR